ncbi:hypothetical protein [Acidithiobacillus concretivorus]|uniref:Uncharacterized protein n=1 Tax=Acidithiobacillus concretivorus TaxID=3063952 RepID=A0ABS5ZPF3_9PROT|nr:hypothetical protein [Acidithiobacillus concretivorus]MBU2738549.1 hypothetical protein [Acidithiobacillus concretivorus]
MEKIAKKQVSPEQKIPFHPDPKHRGILYTIRAAQMQSVFKPVNYIMPCRVGVVGGVSAADVYIVEPTEDKTPIFLNVGNDPDKMAKAGQGDPLFLGLIQAFVRTAVDLETEYPCIPEDENMVCLFVRNEAVYGHDQEWDGCGFRCAIGKASHKEFAMRFQKAFPAGAASNMPGAGQTRH